MYFSFTPIVVTGEAPVGTEKFDPPPEINNEVALQSGEVLKAISQIGGNSHTLTIQGSYLYINIGPRLVIMDISDPIEPTVVGQSEPIGISSRAPIFVSGDYAYVGCPTRNTGELACEGLKIIDVSDPSTPVLAGSMDTPGYSITDISVEGDYVYLAKTSSNPLYGGAYLHVVDVSDPQAPFEITTYELGGWSGSGCYIFVSDNHVYMTGYSDVPSLAIFDVSTPTNPVLTGIYDFSHYPLDIFVSDTYEYLLGFNELAIIDVSDPYSANEVGSLEMSISSGSVTLAGSNVYIADNTSGLRVVNAQDPLNPVEIGFYPIPNDVRDIAIAGNYVYLADWSAGLRIMDVSHPSTPVELEGYSTLAYATNVHVFGNYAYVTEPEVLPPHGDLPPQIWVIDISRPSSPMIKSAYALPGDASDLFVAGNYAYVTGEGFGMRVIDVSNPTDLNEVGEYSLIGALQIKVLNDYAYLLGSGKFFIIDVSDPTLPTKISDMNAFDAAKLDIQGDYAYVGRYEFPWDGGLQIIDIANPAAPFEVSRFDDVPIVTIDTSGSLTYAMSCSTVGGCAGGRLIVYDTSDPLDVFQVGEYSFIGYELGHSISVAWDYAYVVSNGYYVTAMTGSTLYRVSAIDISNPKFPYRVDYYNCSDGEDIFATGPYVFLADSWGGLVILENSHVEIIHISR